MNAFFHKLIGYLLPLIIGASVAIATGAFDFIVNHLSRHWHNNLLATTLNIPPAWLRATLPILAIPLILYTLKHLPNHRQHNQADIIESIHINQGKLDLKSAGYSILGALISLSSGYSVGQYGPTVQQGSAVGYIFSRLKVVKNDAFHVYIASGVAAAIAAIFHAPIAAVVFAHEVILRFFSIKAFAPITISAVTSYILSSIVFNRTTFLSSSPQIIASPNIYAIVVLLAILAGILGILFIRSIMSLQILSRRRHLPVSLRISLAAIAMSFFAYYLPDVMGTSDYFLHAIVNEYDIALQTIALILIAKFIATTLTLGFGIPGGVFSPAIFMGALLGACATQIINHYLPNFETQDGLLTITTMAAMASAVMGAPLSMILIILEITDNFTLTSAVMLAVVIANLTAYRLLGANSFFDAQLKARGINMEIGRDLLYFKQRRIQHLVSDQYLNLKDHTSLADAERLLLEKRQYTAYVTTDEQHYLGKITLVNIRHALRKDPQDTLTIAELANDEGEKLYHLSTIWDAIEVMGHFDGTHIPILQSPEDPILIGVLYESTLIKEYLNDMQHIRSREHG